MSFYDHFFKSKESSVTPIGKKIVNSQNRYFFELIKRFSAEKSNLKILEIGPGKGSFAQVCQKNNVNYYAIEANHKMVKILKNKGFKKVKLGTVPPIKILEDNFDVIFMNQVLEHMKDHQEAIGLVKGCRKKLKENGLLIVSSPEILYWSTNFWAGDYTHSYPTSETRLKKLFFDHNFEVKFTTLYSLNLKGKIWAKIISLTNNFCYWIGIWSLIFRQKAYKVKNSLSPSVLIIGKKNE